MNPLRSLQGLTSSQRHTFIACLLGWALDAFDYFILVFALKAIAEEFHTDLKKATVAITLTLAMRPVGAFLFGRAADRFGRKRTLIVNVVAYSVLELLSATSQSLPILLLWRGLYGVAMGGEWGVGAALALESLPADRRGPLSGLLQQGYVLGYLLAALLFGLLFDRIGWRGMFAVGALPALLVLYLRSHTAESPTWQKQAQAQGPRPRLTGAWLPRFAYLVALMAAFNLFSHGTQDLYPTFLLKERGLSPGAVSRVAIIYNLGALFGGLTFGALSERWGRRRAIAVAALLALPMVPLWVSASPWLLVTGAFALQFMVQGAWGIVPAHLNELSPPGARGTFPGLAYQLGNLIAASLATVQAAFAERHGGDLAPALSATVVLVALTLTALALLGPEAKGAEFG